MSPSIRVDLLKWLIVPLLVVNLIGGLLVYILAWTPAEAAMDRNLSEMAFDLKRHLRYGPEGPEVDLSDTAELLLRSNENNLNFFVVRIGFDTLSGDREFPTLIAPERYEVPYAYSGRLHGLPVRIVTLNTMLGADKLTIGVAETLAERRESQSSILLGVLGLVVVLVVTSAAIAWFAVTEGLFPLQKMQKDLDARAPNDLSPVDQRQPMELQPLVKAINGLLSRAQSDAKSRETFLANVAHQLRTPLAGLQTQLSLLCERHADDRDTSRTLALMSGATERMVRHTNQLLALARAEPAQAEMRRRETIRLDKVLEETVDPFVRAAMQKEIDIGFELAPARLIGDPFLLHDLIDNLVDNSLRYTQRGGTVTIRCREEDGAVFEVEDNGPGIPLADRDKVFSRFYRVDTMQAGTGLGLAIVSEIAATHRASISIFDGAGGTGTLVRVCFPKPTQKRQRRTA